MCERILCNDAREIKRANLADDLAGADGRGQRQVGLQAPIDLHRGVARAENLSRSLHSAIEGENFPATAPSAQIA